MPPWTSGSLLILTPSYRRCYRALLATRSIEGNERAGGGILLRQRLIVVEGRGDLLGGLVAKWSGQGYLGFF